MAIRYITASDLIGISTNLNEELRKTTASYGVATFLSHSSKDVNILPGAIHVLSNHGAEVYIDKKDPSLPPYTSRETAKILRDRIAQNKKFVLLASSNSKDSRWIPWELGLADGNKRQFNVAIFPAVENQHDINWTNQEYLGIYDRIVFGDMQGRDKQLWMVLNQENNTASPLSDWLRS
jgi:hypothetical protein